MTRVLSFLVVFGVLAAAAPGNPTDRFTEANALFERGVTQLGKSDALATRDLRAAAETYETLVDRDGIQSSDLLTNAGNARLLAGDVGQAIALYHRALRIDPADANARKNIEVARARARADSAVAPHRSVIDTATFWRRALTPETRLLIALGAWGVVWLWAAARFTNRLRIRAAISAIPAAIVLAITATSLAADHLVAHAKPVGVVTAAETTARTGPDAVAYDPSFSRPLPEGTEFLAREHRAGWILGELPDGRSAWVPERDVTIIDR